MKTIEKAIIATYFQQIGIGEKHDFKLSTRDRVYNNVSRLYYLWDTCLISNDWINNPFTFYIYTSSKGANNKSLISSTTKSRLNAFLHYLGFCPLTQKNFELYIGDRKIKTDTNYKLNSKTMTITEVED